MIKDLPRESRYVALMTWRQRNGEDVDEPEEVSELRREQEERHEIRQWSDLGYELQAAQVNLLQDLLRYTPQWSKRPPEAERVGPSWWKEKSKRKKKDPDPAKPPTVLDAMRAMGFDGPAPEAAPASTPKPGKKVTVLQAMRAMGFDGPVAKA